MMPYKIPTRCYFFDDDGFPRRKGCLKGDKCKFTHPEDPGWEDAYKGGEKRPEYRPSDEDWNDGRHGTGHSNNHERYDKPKRDYSHQRREYDDSRRPSGSKSRSRLSRSPVSRRSRESRSPGEHSQRRKDSGLESSRSRQYEEEREGRRRSYDDPATRRRDRHRGDPSPSSIASSTNEHNRATVQLQSTTTSAREVLPTPPTTSESVELTSREMARSNATPSHSGMVPPATHPTTARKDSIAMPPPPPSAAPPLPSGSSPAPVLSSRSASGIPQKSEQDVRDARISELSPEEKVTMWLERIKLLSESVQTYEQFQTLEEQYDKSVKFTESRHFTSLPDEDRKRLTAQVATLLSRRDGTQQAYLEFRDKLVKTSPWPMAPLQPSPEEREKHSALVKDITELRDTIDKLQYAFGETSKPLPTLFLRGSDSDDEEENQLMHMNIDQSPENTHKRIPLPSRKRQRTDDSTGEADHTRPSQAAEDMPTKKELEEYHDKLLQYQEQLSALWNHCNSREAELHAEFELKIEDKIDEFQQKRKEEQRVRDEEQDRQEVAKNAAIREMDERVSQDGRELVDLSDTMAEMLRDVDKLEDELQRERAARDESYQRVLQVEQRLQDYIAAQQSNADKLHTLEAALKAYTTRPPSPPMSPKVLAPSYLLQSLEQPLTDSLRTSIQPLIEELRRDVENLVQEKNMQLYSTVWEKIQPSLNVLNLIQQRMDADRSSLQPQAPTQ